MNINETKEYYVLIKVIENKHVEDISIKLNNSIDFPHVNHNIEVIGIFSSKQYAENKIPQYDNISSKYITQGPFFINGQNQFKTILPTIIEDDLDILPKPLNTQFTDNFPDDGYI